jgi:hypothetical protein
MDGQPHSLERGRVQQADTNFLRTDDTSATCSNPVYMPYRMEQPADRVSTRQSRALLNTCIGIRRSTVKSETP